MQQKHLTKAFDKNPVIFYDKKKFNKVGIEENFLNLLKDIHKKTIVNIILNFSLSSGRRQGCELPPFHSTL